MGEGKNKGLVWRVMGEGRNGGEEYRVLAVQNDIKGFHVTMLHRETTFFWGLNLLVVFFF